MTKQTVWLTLGLAALTLALAGCGRPATAGPRPDSRVALDIREKLASGASADASGGAAASTGTGWATLRGKFTYDGQPPAPGRLVANKDVEVCGHGQGFIPDNSLQVGPDGGISNIVVYARANRVHESAAPLEPGASPSPLDFDQKECMFLSHVTACQVGQPVAVRNSDPIVHNTNISSRRGLGLNQMLSPNQEITFTPNTEEASPMDVTCNVHPWMKAYILPRDDKYFAVTKPDGTFEIPNLPAGEDLELQVWHERASGRQGALVLDRKDLKWSRNGRFKVKLEADTPMELTLAVPPSAFN